MNAIVSFRQCTLTNEELREKVDEMTDELFDYKHKSKRDRILTRHIPAQPNDDYDLLIGELLVRFLEMEKELEESNRLLFKDMGKPLKESDFQTSPDGE